MLKLGEIKVGIISKKTNNKKKKEELHTFLILAHKLELSGLLETTEYSMDSEGVINGFFKL